MRPNDPNSGAINPGHWLNPSLHWLEDARATLPLQTYKHIEPALGRVVLRMVDSDTVSQGGIIFPYGSQESTSVGVVETTCVRYESAEDDEDRATHGPMYSVGDIVVISKYTGTELTIDRKKRIICYESDILARLVVAPLPATPALALHSDSDQR